MLQVAAARAAPAIERARLFSALEHEHRVAMVLQRSLLPKRPGRRRRRLSLAARYLPARDEVGGDWYDVFELPRGRVGVAIGDVVGHGIRGGALMGRLRTALHAYAIEGHGPGRTLELVDRFVQSMTETGDGDRGVRGARPVSRDGPVRELPVTCRPIVILGVGRRG